MKESCQVINNLMGILMINRTLNKYKEYFKDKIVYCNCDDHKTSHFVTHFLCNFKDMGLKKLISSCYQKIDPSIYTETTADSEIPELNLKALLNDGDFRSKECIELLKQSDIVVTQPPAKIVIEHISQVLEYDKKFLVLIENTSKVSKYINSLVKSNKVQIEKIDNNMMWVTNILEL